MTSTVGALVRDESIIHMWCKAISNCLFGLTHFKTLIARFLNDLLEPSMYFAHINLAQLEFSKKAEATKLFQYLGGNHNKQHLDWKGNNVISVTSELFLS